MMTLAILLLCVMVWMLQPDWALSLDHTEPVAVLTSQVYHRDPEHLMANMVAFAGLGYDFERRYRSPMGLLLFCVGAGTIAISIEALLFTGSGLLYGASGFVAALCGVYVRDWWRALIASPIIVPLLWGACTAEPGVAHGAHVGGLVVGVLSAVILTLAKEPASP